jgi:hypothetical protein
VARPPLNNEDNALVEGRVDQFRETLPLLDLNLTGHAENPRGWTAQISQIWLVSVLIGVALLVGLAPSTTACFSGWLCSESEAVRR